MRKTSRNITIALDETLDRWVREEASRRNTSAPRFVATLIRQQMTDDSQYVLAMNEALAREPFTSSGGSYLSREDAHKRDRT